MVESKIEKEYKMMLSKEEFKNLLASFPKAIINDQINYYYDSKPSVYARGFGIRIRELNNKFYFTLKESVPEGKLEFEFEIPNNDINDAKVRELLDKLELFDSLEMIGTLRTIRHIHKDEFGELCIDENHYNGIVDYEVEYELFDHTLDKLEHFKNILKMCNIEFIQNNTSKIRRFRNSL